MTMDRRAEGDFMEAIAAMMVVTVSLTVFMGLLSAIDCDDTDDGPDVDAGFVKDLRITDGEIVGETHDDLVYLLQRERLSRISVTVRIVGSVDGIAYSDSCGDTLTDNVLAKNGTIMLDSDDGRRLAASYEVVYWF
jgi:hypothetical protein